MPTTNSAHVNASSMSLVGGTSYYDQWKEWADQQRALARTRHYRSLLLDNDDDETLDDTVQQHMQLGPPTTGDNDECTNEPQTIMALMMIMPVAWSQGVQLAMTEPGTQQHVRNDDDDKENRPSFMMMLPLAWTQAAQLTQTTSLQLLRDWQ